MPAFNEINNIYEKSLIDENKSLEQSILKKIKKN